MRAANMQALTGDVSRRWPGVVIYGVGDAAHQGEKSGHNEDDTPGVRAELQDADTKPEHRAIDIMLKAGVFTSADAEALVAALLADPAARARLFYIIWNGHIWSRSDGWTKRTYTGRDQHTDHVHLSGWAADDENTAGWPAVNKGGVTPVWCSLKDSGENVRRLQIRLKNLGFDPGVIDSSYGDKTAVALKAACTSVYPKYNGDGKSYQADEDMYLDVLIARKYGKDAPDLTPILNKMQLLEKTVASLVQAASTAQPGTPAPGYPTAFKISSGVIQLEPIEP